MIDSYIIYHIKAKWEKKINNKTIIKIISLIIVQNNKIVITVVVVDTKVILIIC